MSAQPVCYALKGTTTCPPWSTFSLQQNPGVLTSVMQFDTYITERQDNHPKYIASLQTQCPGYTGEGFRYHQSFLCALSADISTYNGCNEYVPPSLCQSSARAYMASLKALFDTPGMCTQPLQIPDQFNTFMQRLSNETAGCVIGVEHELAQCGFMDAPSARDFCTDNPSEACCANLGKTGLSPYLGGSAPTPKKWATPAPPAPSPVSTPAPNETAKSSASGSSSASANLGYIIGGVVGGLALIIACVFLYLFLRRRQLAKASAKTSVANGGAVGAAGEPIQIAETLQVYFDYTPNLSDEIALYTGDRVIVKVKFDDGWGFGFNMTTKQEGSFPMACLGPVGGSGGAGRDSTRFSHQSRARSQISQRMSSLYIPN